MRIETSKRASITLVSLLGLTGCFAQSEGDLVIDAGESAATHDAASSDPDRDTGTSKPSRDGGVSAGSSPLRRARRIDLLFVIDDSNSMMEEQAALARELPRLITTLTTGMRDAEHRYAAPVTDLHLGVVSSDMGLVGVEGIPGCSGMGKDGLLQTTCMGTPVGTGASFLGYRAGDGQTPDSLATQFGCIAQLGTGGCGFEQPLEAALKALWPADDRNPATGKPYEMNRVTFLAPTPEGSLGHGDGANARFLRTDPEDPSLLAVIFVSDEEDCSSSDTRHFTPQHSLDPSDPLYGQHLNMRCFFNKASQYPVSRYVEGLRALRPGNEHLVVFGAIVGVPADLVEPNALASYDFGSASEREMFYRSLLDDPRMIEQQDPTRPADRPNLRPSCVGTSSDGMSAPAYPPRRFVEAARGFGANGRVQSICQDDFSPAVDVILDMMAPHLMP